MDSDQFESAITEWRQVLTEVLKLEGEALESIRRADATAMAAVRQAGELRQRADELLAELAATDVTDAARTP
ncbi:hypothetical protein PE066_05010 [Ramlibacter tataouinensis]|uniref:hypothetical protein n=1 Tax=Ramlibacter tataouinensis TaxID=94132 RepID=UPI0022F40199|nr:hypothetical protein [Ramlibacter tataouinensis]WBY02901.1 hypothetical protein PE066_05010 [Ramlibacter tataouinensis]